MSTTVVHQLPPVVDGIPLLDLAAKAVGAARAYSVTVPQDVQTVVSTQAALYKLIPEAGVLTTPEYVVVLRGRFHCPSGCGISVAAPQDRTTLVTSPQSVRMETMVLEIPEGRGTGPNGLSLGVFNPGLSKLGRVYDLNPYVHSLANTKVRVGPFPG